MNDSTVLYLILGAFIFAAITSSLLLIRHLRKTVGSYGEPIARMPWWWTFIWFLDVGIVLILILNAGIAASSYLRFGHFDFRWQALVPLSLLLLSRGVIAYGKKA